MDNTIPITLVCTLLGACIGYFTFQRNKSKDTKEEASTVASIATKLDYIQRGVDDIRVDIKTQDRKINDMDLRLVRVEESTKSAHHRIDKIEEEK